VSDSVTVSVEVAVSQTGAFDIFTREIDAWYRVDPDTLPDITRTAAIGFEPRVGGRFMDVHDRATGAGREIGRVTAWEHGRRLAFTDNEGSEVEVSFEPAGAGTNVVLCHRGLDRVVSQRAGELRRSGWAALAPVYRAHVAAHARAVAFVRGWWLVGGTLVVVWAALVVVLGRPAAWILLLLPAALIAVGRFEDRLVGRWQLSRWPYRRIWWLVRALPVIGFLIFGVSRVTQHGADPLFFLGLPILLLLNLWSGMQAGPAEGRSLRNLAVPARQTLHARHPHRFFVGMAGGAALGIALGAATVLAGGKVAEAATLAALMAVGAGFSLRAGVSKLRQKRTLGFDPDLYVAVGRRVRDENRRPELLVHQPSRHPEYSGWYAYASEQDEHSRDVGPWTLKDLVDHSPEAARPLREGHGKWEWDQAKRSYFPAQGAEDIVP